MSEEFRKIQSEVIGIAMCLYDNRYDAPAWLWRELGAALERFKAYDPECKPSIAPELVKAQYTTDPMAGELHLKRVDPKEAA